MVWKSSVIAIAVALAFSSGNSNAQTSTCTNLQAGWDASEKKKSSVTVEEITDTGNSAPRATLRVAQISNELLTQSIIIQQLTAHKCQIPSFAPSLVSYINPAMECALAKARPGTPKEERDQKCNQAAWKIVR